MNSTTCNEGIYALKVIETGRCLYGESRNLDAMKRSQKNKLQMGKHYCKELQDTFNSGNTVDFQVLARIENPYMRSQVFQTIIGCDSQCYNKPTESSFLSAYGIDPKSDTRKYVETPVCLLQSLLKKVDKTEGVSTSERLNRILEAYFKDKKRME